MGPLARLLSSAWGIVSKMLGRSFNDWAEWAALNPVAAALELDTIATVLEGRATAYRRRDGWRARRDRGIASPLRLQARRFRSCLNDAEVSALCRIPPGTMPTVARSPG